MPYRKKHDYELYKRELEEQLDAILDWDDYDPEHYGWGQDSRTRHIRRANMELAKELAMVSIPHKTRRFHSVK